jgi:NCS1 family nucleobase:cation symporter-1
VAGIMICDYFVIRRRVLVLNDLYLRGGEYEYSSGFNWAALGSLTLGAATALVGLVVPALRTLYDYSWFVGFAVAFVTYYGWMRTRGETKPSAVGESG